MKKIFYSIMALALCFGAGSALAQTSISFPFEEMIDGSLGLQEYTFTLEEPVTLSIPKVDVIESDVEVVVSQSGYFVAGGRVSEEPLNVWLNAGTYSMEVQNSVEEDFLLKMNLISPEPIVLSYNKELTLEASEYKVLTFTLTYTCLVAGKMVYDLAYSVLGVPAPVEASLTNANGYESYDGALTLNGEILQAGTYYLHLRNLLPDENVKFDLKLNSTRFSSLKFYYDISYNTTLTKGAFVAGAFANTDLGKFQYSELFSEDQFALMKGFRLSMTAGKQYQFSNLPPGLNVCILKAGDLTGDLTKDAVFISGSDHANLAYIATATSTLRVLILSQNDLVEGAYALTVTEGNAPIITPWIDVLDAAVTIDYAALPLSLVEPVSLRTRIYLDETTNWLTPATAFKIDVPEENEGLNVHVFPNSYLLMYQKMAEEEGLEEEYVLVYVAEKFETYGSPMDPGEYYFLCVNLPGVPETDFNINIWITDMEPGFFMLKDLLDITTSEVTLPFSTIGNTADGMNVLMDNYGISAYSKTMAWKVSFEEESELFIRSNMAVMLFQSDGVDDYYQLGWTATDGYLAFESGWSILAPGEYYVVGVFDQSGGIDGDFWLKLTTEYKELDITITSITTSTKAIGVNKTAGPVEIKTMLSLLPLTFHLSNELTISFANDVSYWDLAADGKSATLNPWMIDVYPFTFDEDMEALTILISKTGPDLNYIDPSDISSLGIKAYSIYMQGNTVVASGVETGIPYGLFDITGKMIASGITRSDVLNVNVYQKGVYILRIGTQTAKVLVK